MKTKMKIWDKPFEGPPIKNKLMEKIRPFLNVLAVYNHYQVHGLERIPAKGRTLLVLNHSFATYDGFLLGAAILIQRKRHPLGLADSNFFLFPSVGEFASRIGLLEASHENAEKALREEQLLAVAPGGMREALRPKEQRYQVLWKKRRGFVKLALRTQTPIVLAACPRADDLFDIYPNALTKWMYQHLKWPFVLLKGWGPTLLPKPVKLIHFLSEPIMPPPWKEGEGDFAELTREFHARVTREMRELMKVARKYEPAPTTSTQNSG